MAYRDDIQSLGADHLWTFTGDVTDFIGTADGTNSGMLLTAPAIAEDGASSTESNATSDRVTLPSSADINSSAQDRKAMCGWVQLSKIQPPPDRIYGEGDQTTSFAFVIALGNNVMFETTSSSFILQVFGDRILRPGRSYHLCGIFEGSGFGDTIRFYIDGVRQTLSQPDPPSPGVTTLAARGVGEFGDPAGTVGVGGGVVLLGAPTNCRYQHWASFSGASAVLTDASIRGTLFEKGALPDVTISTGTESAMQSSLDALADTVRPDAPLAIRVQAVTGGGDLTLTADNITFDPLCSIHVQYMGTGVLTWRNINGSDASIGSTPNGGTVSFLNNVVVSVTVLDASDQTPVTGARVFLETDIGGPLPSGTVVVNALTDASGNVQTNFDFSSSQPVKGRVRKGTSAPLYKTGILSGSITSSGLSLTSLVVRDE